MTTGANPAATKPPVNPRSPTGGLKSLDDRSDIVSRLNAPLPDEVWLRYYRDHPDEPLLPEHEHLRVAVGAAGKPAAEEPACRRCSPRP